MSQRLERLERWYLSQCDEEWEHRYGINIESLDNPGWSVKIDLTGTDCESRPFAPVQVGTIVNNNTPEVWIDCRVEERVFLGASNSLSWILDVFLKWREVPGGADCESAKV